MNDLSLFCNIPRDLLLGIQRPQEEKDKEMTGRIRSAGPMVLSNCTDAEINQLRRVCSRPGSKIKYLALAFTEHNKGVKIVAQAYEKLSTPVWREQLGYRIKEIKSAGNLKQVVDGIRSNAMEFIEYGSHGRQEARKTGMKRKQPEESTDDDMCCERVEQEVGLPDKQALQGLIMAREAYLRHEKLYEMEFLSTGSPQDTSDIQLDDISGIFKCCPPLQDGEIEKRSQLALIMARDAFLKREKELAARDAFLKREKELAGPCIPPADMQTERELQEAFEVKP